MTTDRKIREAIKKRMSEKGITQRELGERLGITQGAVSQIISMERGKVPQSLIDVLEALDLELTVTDKGER